ncbi:hypothetical protein BGX33_000706 [Mortierella sp. NVP41]|nr:hypothetical protein BGX33_000706 [Mortierella sp. NVP41]
MQAVAANGAHTRILFAGPELFDLMVSQAASTRPRTISSSNRNPIHGSLNSNRTQFYSSPAPSPYNIDISKDMTRLQRLQFAQLNHLEDLNVSSFPVPSGTKKDNDLFFKFFESLPTSLQSLAIARSDLVEQENAGRGTLDEIGTKRQGPLHRLTRMELDRPSDFSAKVLQCVFKASPALEALKINGTDKGGLSYPTMVECIPQFCPRLKELSFTNAHMSGSRNGVSSILSAMVADTIEMVHMDESEWDKSSKLVERALLRYSSSLRDIRFKDCAVLAGETVGSILGTCTRLERLDIKQGQQQILDMGLNDVVHASWVCSRLTHLSLVVRYEPFQNTSNFQGDFTMSKMDKRQWRLWQDLCERIGSLMALQDLSLQLATSGAEKDQKTFSGFLALEDKGTGRPGFLNELKGLSQLRVLHGPFTLDLPEMVATFGLREARWIVKNWPKLKKIQLMRSKDDLPAFYQERPALAWLKEQRPAMKFY